MINPFSPGTSNEIISDLNDPEDYNMSNVVGLIFETSMVITSSLTYSHPPIISEDSKSLISQFEPYAYNRITEPGKLYNSTYSHFYIENCQVLSRILPTYLAFALVWVLIALQFIILLCKQPAEARLTL